MVVRAIASAGCIAAVCIAATVSGVEAQQPAAPAGQSASASQAPAPPAKDTIFARKILMGTIDMNMDEVETMLEPGGKFEAVEAREHTDLISVMLMSFPHMFPASTNQWRAGAERDAALDTFAAPELWSNFADFYSRATAASATAFNASRAPTFPVFKAAMAELRTQCNACHAAYMKIDK